MASSSGSVAMRGFTFPSFNDTNAPSMVTEVPKEVYTGSRRADRPYFSNFVHLYNINHSNTSKFVLWLKQHFNLNSDFNVLQLRREYSLSGAFETRLYAPNNTLFSLYDQLEDTELVFYEESVRPSFSHSASLYNGYEDYLVERATSASLLRMQEFQMDEKGSEVEETASFDESDVDVVSSEHEEEKETDHSEDDNDVATPSGFSPASPPSLRFISAQIAEKQSLLDALQNVGNKVQSLKDELQQVTRRITEQIQQQLDSTGIPNLKYDPYGQYRSNILSLSNLTFGELKRLERSQEEILEKSVAGDYKWTRENFVFWVQKHMPELFEKYVNCFEPWAESAGEIQLGDLTSVVFEVMGINDVNDRREIVCEVEALKVACILDNEVSEAKDQTFGEEGGCIICFAAKATHVFYPCGHLVSCESCANNLMASNEDDLALCPVCRQNIHDLIKVFL